MPDPLVKSSVAWAVFPATGTRDKSPPRTRPARQGPPAPRSRVGARVSAAELFFALAGVAGAAARVKRVAVCCSSPSSEAAEVAEAAASPAAAGPRRGEGRARVGRSSVFSSTARACSVVPLSPRRAQRLARTYEGARTQRACGAGRASRGVAWRRVAWRLATALGTSKTRATHAAATQRIRATCRSLTREHGRRAVDSGVESLERRRTPDPSRLRDGTSRRGCGESRTTPTTTPTTTDGGT